MLKPEKTTAKTTTLITCKKALHTHIRIFFYFLVKKLRKLHVNKNVWWSLFSRELNPVSKSRSKEKTFMTVQLEYPKLRNGGKDA